MPSTTGVHSPDANSQQMGVGAAPAHLHLDQQCVAVGRHARRATPLGWGGDRTRPDRRAGRCPADGSGCDGCTGRRAGNGRTRSRVPSGSHATDAARVSAMRRSSSSPVSTCSTCSTLSSVPPSLSPIATSEPSSEGSNQSIATAASAARSAGSSSRRGGTGIDRRAHHQRELVGAAARSSTNSASPRTLHLMHRRQRDERGKALVPPSRSGRASSACRVYWFWAATHWATRVVARLEPPIRIGQLDAVDGVDHVLAPGGRRR